MSMMVVVHRSINETKTEHADNGHTEGNTEKLFNHSNALTEFS